MVVPLVVGVAVPRTVHILRSEEVPVVPRTVPLLRGEVVPTYTLHYSLLRSYNLRGSTTVDVKPRGTRLFRNNF